METGSYILADNLDQALLLAIEQLENWGESGTALCQGLKTNRQWLRKNKNLTVLIDPPNKTP